MSIVTLTTDFGLKDGNVGVMKGVIWSIAPRAQIADISHQISPQNIPEAALVISRAAPYFPPGTVHVVVVDPGVGTARRPIGAQLSNQFYVAPDNGVLTLLLEQAERAKETVEFVHLNRPNFWLTEVSNVFHGRDIFAPVAGHLAAGVPLRVLGSPISDPVRLTFPQPQHTANGLTGEVIHIDHFGNIHTNIRIEHLGQAPNVQVKICSSTIAGMVKTFGERPDGELIALYGSSGNLIISTVNGSAAKRLGANIGDLVEVIK